MGIQRGVLDLNLLSPNQVLTHAARAAAKQLNKVPFQAPPGAARVGVWVLRWTHTFYLEDQNFNI